jgi:O-methyltransferase
MTAGAAQQAAPPAMLTSLQQYGRILRARAAAARFEPTIARLYRKYRAYTMVPRRIFAENLRLCRRLSRSPGCIVECGVWRGGMTAAMAEVLGSERRYYLFDSFEGLPPARAIDGAQALAWQADTTGAFYYDNCRAEQAFAEAAMKRSGARSYTLVKGWFKDTLPGFVLAEPIAILRLDADWYDSTLECLTHLYPRVRTGGLVIVDDYFHWDGCARAVHDFLSRHALCDRIRESRGVGFIEKRAGDG